MARSSPDVSTAGILKSNAQGKLTKTGREIVRAREQCICSEIVSSMHYKDAALMKLQQYGHLNKTFILTPPSDKPVAAEKGASLQLQPKPVRNQGVVWVSIITKEEANYFRVKKKKMAALWS